jgi:thymidylate synthase (FAD)
VSGPGTVVEVEPKIYIWSSTRLEPGFRDYLADIGIPDWESDATSYGDLMIEAAGRLCYRSWIPWDPERPDASNPNVERVRDGNRAYVGNLIKQGHGSVFEHINVGILLANVSRVLTHDLVRHRAGMAYSQESMRFLRVWRLAVWVPTSLRALGPAARETFLHHLGASLGLANDFAAVVGLDDAAGFRAKKTLTALVRRLLPHGVATNILCTGNLRAWRHILATRWSPEAEEEMPVVMAQIAARLKEMYPAAFQDMEITSNGVQFGNRKI